MTKRLLYVEDHRPSVPVLAAVTAMRPQWSLRHADTVQAALAAVSDDRPDLIVLDMNLPDGTGLDVLAVLRDDPDLQSLPVVVLTAETTPGMSQRAAAAGANEYWAKPLDVHEFLALLDRMGVPADHTPDPRLDPNP